MKTWVSTERKNCSMVCVTGSHCKICTTKEKNYTAAALEITVEHRTLNDQKFENARM